MKKDHILIFGALLFGAVLKATSLAFAADPAPLPPKSDDLILHEGRPGALANLKPSDFVSVAIHNAVLKERDDLKARVDQLTGQNQYLQILAERNELAVRVVQMELERAKGELAGATARAAQLQAELNAAQSPKPATPKHEEKK